MPSVGRMYYYPWLLDQVITTTDKTKRTQFSKLLMHLFKTPYMYVIGNDKNRADDGLKLRRLYEDETGNDIDNVFFIEDCSVLEMMVALSIRCENSIMDNPKYGNRTSQWFWQMITNLGLNGQTNDMYDERFVDDVLYTWMSHGYKRNGSGSLFVINNTTADTRNMEIWKQMCLYFDNVS